MTVTAIDRSGPSGALAAMPARGGRPAHRLRTVSGEGCRAATVLLPSTRLPRQAHGDFMQPTVALAYQRHATTKGLGAFVVRIAIVNQAQHIAHAPFLCLRAPGLELAPAPGWTMQDVGSVNQLRRFAQAGSGLLRPRARMHCCSISLLFDAEGGGRLAYEAGGWHALGNLPDLKLTCMAGAGNFPTERLPLVVPAATLKGFIADLIATGGIPRFAGQE